MRANLAAFRRWRIVPRMLRDVARRDLRVKLLGTSLPAPVLLAPVGAQSILHPEAEVAVARAAASTQHAVRPEHCFISDRSKKWPRRLAMRHAGFSSTGVKILS